MLVSFKPIARKNLGDTTATPKHNALVVHKNVKQVTPSKEVTPVFIERIKIGYRSSIELSM
ncbi:hypothetical protein [Aquimarina macrocephali]|uniref:hypothetical protein n=1 Tax=Aquimarina macrocephali TaxID=666563 RepID=UPI0004AE8813|nr:hypothetical protein [Aquimarina macrocephali]